MDFQGRGHDNVTLQNHCCQKASIFQCHWKLFIDFKSFVCVSRIYELYWHCKLLSWHSDEKINFWIKNSNDITSAKKPQTTYKSLLVFIKLQESIIQWPLLQKLDTRSDFSLSNAIQDVQMLHLPCIYPFYTKCFFFFLGDLFVQLSVWKNYADRMHRYEARLCLSAKQLCSF